MYKRQALHCLGHPLSYSTIHTWVHACPALQMGFFTLRILSKNHPRNYTSVWIINTTVYDKPLASKNFSWVSFSMCYRVCFSPKPLDFAYNFILLTLIYVCIRLSVYKAYKLLQTKTGYTLQQLEPCTKHSSSCWHCPTSVSYTHLLKNVLILFM